MPYANRYGRVKASQTPEGQRSWLPFPDLRRLSTFLFLSWAAVGCSSTVDLPILGKVLLPDLPGCRRSVPALEHAKTKTKPAKTESQQPKKKAGSIKRAEVLPTKAPTPLGETIFFLTKEKGFWTIMGIDPLGESLRHISPPSSNAWGLVVSRNGKSLAYLSDQTGSAEVWINSPLGHVPRQLSYSGERNIVADPDAVPRASFSPDGTSLAWIQRGEIWLSGLDG